MISNLSLRTTVLVVSILISGILIPYAAFASPIFETETAETTNSFFEPEQSIANPLWFFDDFSFNENSRITNLDVVVYDETEVYVVFGDLSSTSNISNVFLSYTNSSIINVTNGFFVDTFNVTQTVQLDFDSFDRTFPAFDSSTCTVATDPKIAVTDSFVFVAWKDELDDETNLGDNDGCDGPGGGATRIATIAIPKGNFDDLTTAFFDPLTTKPAYHPIPNTPAPAASFSIAANGTTAYIAWGTTTETVSNIYDRTICV